MSKIICLGDTCRQVESYPSTPSIQGVCGCKMRGSIVGICHQQAWQGEKHSRDDIEHTRVFTCSQRKFLAFAQKIMLVKPVQRVGVDQPKPKKTRSHTCHEAEQTLFAKQLDRRETMADMVCTITPHHDSTGVIISIHPIPAGEVVSSAAKGQQLFPPNWKWKKKVLS